VRQPSIEEPPVERSARGGFSLPLDVVVAPARAFRTIEATREWLPAYAIIVALAFLQLYLLAPGLAHIIAVQAHTGAAAVPAPKAMLAEIVYQAALGTIGPFVMWGFVATLLSAAVLGTGGGLGRFATFFALCMNCAVPAAVGGVVSALAVRLHDPTALRSVSDLLLAAPISLAALRPHGAAREIAFLGYWDVFTLWSLVLLGYGFAALAKVRPVPALLFAFAIGLSFALMQAAQPQ
jgi:Yip1-like protein